MEVSSDQDKGMTLNRYKLNRIDNIATGIWAAQAYSNLKLDRLWFFPNSMKELRVEMKVVAYTLLYGSF